MTTSTLIPPIFFLQTKHWSIVFMTMLVAIVVVSAQAVVYAKYKVRILNVELQMLRHEKLAMETERQQLQIEQGMLTAHGAVERTARTDLDMVLPVSQQVIILRP